MDKNENLQLRDPSITPTCELLEQTLGSSYAAYEEFVIADSELVETPTKSNEELPEELKTKPRKPRFEEKLADIILLLLDKGEISNKAVKARAKVAYDKANDYMDKLEKYNLIPPLEDGRSARKLNPIKEIGDSRKCC